MSEQTMHNFAEAEGYLRGLDGLAPPEAYIAVVAAQAHATLAQAAAAAQMVELQKELLTSMQPAPTPQEQVKAATEEAQALARALPADEEPEEFGSVVRAGIDSISDRVLWLRGAGHYWFSETSRRAIFSDFYKPEVLRIGVGERQDVAPEDTEDYKAGVSDTLYKIHGRLQLLYADAITSERKNALEKAIQAVEELAP